MAIDMVNKRKGKKKMDLVQHLLRQMAFSHATFGPGRRAQGVTAHIKKELIEVLDVEDGDMEVVEEWIDVVLLALDGATRAAIYHDEIGSERGDPLDAVGRVCQALLDKQAENEGRAWPDWRTAPEGAPIEHIRAEITSVLGL